MFYKKSKGEWTDLTCDKLTIRHVTRVHMLTGTLVTGSHKMSWKSVTRWRYKSYKCHSVIREKRLTRSGKGIRAHLTKCNKLTRMYLAESNKLTDTNFTESTKLTRKRHRK
jgi:hypothetical protein